MPEPNIFDVAETPKSSNIFDATPSPLPPELPQTPQESDFNVLAKMYGPEKAALAMKASDYKPGVISGLVNPEPSAVSYLNQLTGQFGSGVRDITLGQANTVQRLLGKAGIVSPEDVAYSDALLAARNKGLEQEAGGVPVGRAIGNIAATFSPISLAGKVGTMANSVRAAKAFWPSAGQAIGRGGLLGMGGAAVQPGATPESVQEAGLIGAALGPAVEKVVAPAVGKAVEGAQWLGRAAKRAITGEGESFAPESIVKQLESRVGGRASDVTKQQLKSQYAADRAESVAAFNELRGPGGPAVVELPSYSKAIDDILGAEASSRAGADPTVVKKISDLKAALENPASKTDFASTVDIGTRLNSILGDALEGKEPNRYLAGKIKTLKGALEQDLDAAGQQYGDKYKAAKELWKQKVVPWEDAEAGGQILQKFIDNPKADTAMSALLASRSRDEVNYFVNQLKKTKQGIPALQAGLARDVYNASLDDGGRVIPDKFIGELKKRQEAYGLTFTGIDKWRMDGLEKLMRESRFLGKLATLGVSSAMGKMGANDASGAVIQKALTSPSLSNFLLEAHNYAPNSSGMEQLVERYWPKLTGASVGISSKVPVPEFKLEAPSSPQNIFSYNPQESK